MDYITFCDESEMYVKLLGNKRQVTKADKGGCN